MYPWLLAHSVTGALVAMLLAPGHALAHAYVAASSPVANSTVREPPPEVSIRFTENVELGFSRIIVKSATGEIVSTGVVRQPADDTLTRGSKPLGPGTYTIEWGVLSVDSHVTDGVLRFTVGPRPPRGSP